MTAVRLSLCVSVLFGRLRCGGSAPRTQEHQLFGFGTLVELTLYGISQQQARYAAQLVDTIYQDWHVWQRSHLQELNEAIAENQATRTDPSVLELTRLGQHLERISRWLVKSGYHQPSEYTRLSKGYGATRTAAFSCSDSALAILVSQHPETRGAGSA